MLFNSLRFLIFFPAAVCGCFLLPARRRYIWLLAASYFFYMCWDAKYALLLLFSTAVTYGSGLLLERLERGRRLCVAVSFTLSLGVLFFFKYFAFAAETLSRALALVHIRLPAPALGLALPVGISFYTFQALSYTVDVYRGTIRAERNFLRYALFVSFFPQLVAGPIERSGDLLGQLSAPPRPTAEQLRDGVLLMLWGYFLKVVLADRIAIVVDRVYGYPGYYTGWYFTAATVLFAFQIYCDFAGYSTIAMGAAEILGVRLRENFDAPYLSRTTGQFWRRWHISLGAWFRDYLYIPLGGNRRGPVRKYLNLMAVFLASGLGHGADWSFVVWGGLNGLYLVVGGVSKPFRDRVVQRLGLHRESLGHRLLQGLITFALVDVAWVFFRAQSVEQAVWILQSMAHAGNFAVLFDGSLYKLGVDEKSFRLMLLCIAALLAADGCKRRGIRIRAVIARQDAWVRWLTFAASVSFILLTGVWGPGYDPASFLYFQF